MTQGNIGFEKVRRTRKVDTEDGRKDVLAVPKRRKRESYAERDEPEYYRKDEQRNHKPYG